MLLQSEAYAISLPTVLSHAGTKLEKVLSREPVTGEVGDAGEAQYILVSQYFYVKFGGTAA
jgi:hypothetical protein